MPSGAYVRQITHTITCCVCKTEVEARRPFKKFCSPLCNARSQTAAAQLRSGRTAKKKLVWTQHPGIKQQRTLGSGDWDKM